MLRGNKCRIYWPPPPVCPSRRREDAAGTLCHKVTRHISHISVEIEAASRWGLGGRQLPKEVLSRKHLCSLITPLLFITTAKHRVQVITVNHILLPFIILSLGKTLLCFWRHPCCRPWLFISWVQRLKCAVITFWILGFTWPRRKPLKQIFGNWAATATVDKSECVTV